MEIFGLTSQPRGRLGPFPNVWTPAPTCSGPWGRLRSRGSAAWAWAWCCQGAPASQGLFHCVPAEAAAATSQSQRRSPWPMALFRGDSKERAGNAGAALGCPHTPHIAGARVPLPAKQRCRWPGPVPGTASPLPGANHGHAAVKPPPASHVLGFRLLLGETRGTRRRPGEHGQAGTPARRRGDPSPGAAGLGPSPRPAWLQPAPGLSPSPLDRVYLFIR